MRIPAILLAAGVLATSSGCAAVRDFTAWLTGAPSSQEIAAEQKRLDQAEDKVQELETQQAAAEAKANELERIAATQEVRKAEVRQLYARLAAELANLEGTAADAMVETLAGLQRQLEAIGEEADAAIEIAAHYRAEAEQLIGAQAEARRIIADAEANLQGFADATEAAIAGVIGGVTLAGETAASLGVPGAREAAATVTRIGEGILGSILFGGTVGGGLLARRRRKQRDEEAKRRENLGRIVTAVEKFGLIGAAGPELEEARKAAKDWAGLEAHHELKKTLHANGGVAAA